MWWSLAAGQQIHPDPDGKPISVNVVTLLLKPEDTEKVVLATSLGAIHFVLRNGVDGEQALESLRWGLISSPGQPLYRLSQAAVTAESAKPLHPRRL